MKKHIILIRHASSHPADQGQKDIDRDLDNNGIQDISRVGRYLYLKNMIPDLILTSHARRAVYSTQLIAEQLKLDGSRIKIIEDLYEASVRTLINQISELDPAIQVIAIIGHNPSLLHLCEHLSNDVINQLPPAGMVYLSFNNLNWNELDKGTGSLVETILPDQITF